jgi:hypothetical protein
LLVYPILVPVAVGGWLVLVRRCNDVAWRVWVGRALAVSLVLFLWMPAQRTDKRRLLRTLRNENPYRGADPQAATAAIERLSKPDDTLFVWGIQPEFHLFARRAPATRMVTCAFLSGTLRHDVRMGEHPPVPDLIPGAWDALMLDLKTSRPRLIVDTAPGGRAGYDRIPATSMPRLASHLSSHYRLEGRFGNMDIYVRLD